jgi:hypothetical protein
MVHDLVDTFSRDEGRIPKGHRRRKTKVNFRPSSFVIGQAHSGTASNSYSPLSPLPSPSVRWQASHTARVVWTFSNPVCALPSVECPGWQLVQRIVRPQQFCLHAPQNPRPGVAIDAAGLLGRVIRSQVHCLSAGGPLEKGRFRLGVAGSAKWIVCFLSGSKGKATGREKNPECHNPDQHRREPGNLLSWRWVFDGHRYSLRKDGKDGQPHYSTSQARLSLR